MFERILVPVELGEFDTSVLAFVEGILREGTQEVVLVHALDVSGQEQIVVRQKEETALARLATLSGVLAAADVMVTPVVSALSPSDAVLSIASERDVSLIVTGTRGKSALSELAVGSTSEAIGRAATMPVLLLPFELLDHRAAAELLTLGERCVSNVLFATDFSEVSERSLDLLKGLDPAHVERIFVTTVIAEREAKDDPAGARTTTRILRAIASELRELGVASVHKLLFGPPAASLLKAAADGHATCIALGSHGKGLGEELLLGSVSQAIIRDSTIPVLVTH